MRVFPVGRVGVMAVGTGATHNGSKRLILINVLEHNGTVVNLKSGWLCCRCQGRGKEPR